MMPAYQGERKKIRTLDKNGLLDYPTMVLSIIRSFLQGCCSRPLPKTKYYHLNPDSRQISEPRFPDAWAVIH
jgi:hypothetical protein